MKGAIDMSVSQVFVKDGERYAFVSFTDGEKNAEGKIPDCRIISVTGFDDVEVRQLEDYMKKELARLKRMAAGVNAMRAFMEP